MEEAELDSLLTRVDQLTLLKTRARYTLQPNMRERLPGERLCACRIAASCSHRCGNCCAYCHTAEDLTIVVFEFEHIVPRVLGGETILDNLCLACPTCNRFKADRTAAPDPATGEGVPLFHPQRDGWTQPLRLEGGWHPNRRLDSYRSGHRGCAPDESSAVGPHAPDVGGDGRTSSGDGVIRGG